MSQNDLSIANQGFASFRSDLNSALQALGSTNSGTSAPSTTYANQLFYDTTNNILKIRNEDNDAFISLFTLDQSNDNIESLTVNGVLTSDSLQVDNLNLNGTTFSASGDLTVDCSQDIILDSDTGAWRFKDAGTAVLTISRDSNTSVIISNAISDSDLSFKGIDDSSTIEAMRIDFSAGGAVGIGTSSPTGIHSQAKVLELSGGDGGDLIIGNNSSSNTSSGQHIGAIAFKNIDTSLGTAPHYAGIRCEATDSSGNMDLRFYTGTANLESDSPQVTINDSGKVGIATGSLGIAISEALTIAGAGTSTSQARIKFSKADSCSTGNDFARIIFNNSANTDLASIGCVSMNGNTESGLAFNAGGGNTERIRIDNSGNLIIGATGAFTSGSSNTGGSGTLMIARDAERCLIMKRSSGNGEVVNFLRGGTTNPVGTISITTSSTSYNTSSDYRLKENVVTDWDATARLKQLKPSRFNFKTDKDTTVDGFLAHEVESIVPEAITGIKDAVDKDGNLEAQQIDLSKLVPLLVKTVQELESRIATLEAK